MPYSTLLESTVPETASQLLSEYLLTLDTDKFVSLTPPLQIIVEDVKKKPQLQIEIPNKGLSLEKKSQSCLDVSPKTAEAESPFDMKISDEKNVSSPDLQLLYPFELSAGEKNDTTLKPEELKVLQVILEKKSEIKDTTSSKLPLSASANFATLTYELGYSGKGQKLRSFQVVHNNKLDPMIYWEQKTNIAFCTLNLDFETINKRFYGSQETLYDVYQRSIIDNSDPIIHAFPFDQWFQIYLDCLPSHHIFKNYYLLGLEKQLFTLTILDEKSMAQCEMIFCGAKARVRGDHPNKPYDPLELNQELSMGSQWLLFDTTLLATKSIAEQKEFLLEKNAKQSNRELVKMIYVKNITKDKIYVIWDQPGKIYHSIFISKLFNAEGSRLPEDNYDGGTIIFNKGNCLHVENDSGHIRSSKENFLHRGLCKNLVDANAYHELKSLVMHFHNKNKEYEILRIDGSKNIANFLRSEGLFEKISPSLLHAPLERCVLKMKNKHHFKKKPRDSIKLYKMLHLQEEILSLIGTRIIEILEKKWISEEKLAEKKLLETILIIYFKSYPRDLKKATHFALKNISRKTFKNITSSRNFIFYRTENTIKTILEKIESLPSREASQNFKN